MENACSSSAAVFTGSSIPVPKPLRLRALLPFPQELPKFCADERDGWASLRNRRDARPARTVSVAEHDHVHVDGSCVIQRTWTIVAVGCRRRESLILAITASTQPALSP